MVHNLRHIRTLCPHMLHSRQWQQHLWTSRTPSERGLHPDRTLDSQFICHSSLLCILQEDFNPKWCQWWDLWAQPRWKSTKWLISEQCKRIKLSWKTLSTWQPWVRQISTIGQGLKVVQNRLIRTNLAFLLLLVAQLILPNSSECPLGVFPWIINPQRRNLKNLNLILVKRGPLRKYPEKRPRKTRGIQILQT